MAPRANWKGYLKLSLVSCAVALYPATSTSQRVRFNIINRKTGHRVHNQVVDAESGDPVAEEDRVKGYKVEDDSYVLVEEDELDEVALESTHTIDIESFVPRKEVDEIYLEAPYYLVPEDRIAEEAFAVIRDAMARQNVVGLARVVLYRRERILMLEPRHKGLIATTLRYRNEVQKEDAYFEDIPNLKIPADMLDLALHIVETKAGHFDPDRFEDRYEDAVAELIKAKRAGKAPPTAPEPRPSNVVNLMDALRRSVRAEQPSGSRKGASRSQARKPAKRAAPKKRRLKKAS